MVVATARVPPAFEQVPHRAYPMFSFLARMKSSGSSGTHPRESTQSVLSILTVTPLPESVCGVAIVSSRLNNATLKVRPMDADADAPAQDTAFSNEERAPLLGEPFAIDQHSHGEDDQAASPNAAARFI
jgi:hypothetical protein